METTTKVNKNNVLITLDGVYNKEVHRKLNQVINNIALKYVATNPYFQVDDLKQEAWLKIYEAIDKYKLRGNELELSYLIRVAQNAILAKCMYVSKQMENIDDFSTEIFNGHDRGYTSALNTEKQKIEYKASSHKLNETDSIILRISLEELLDDIFDNKVKYLIATRYIKEFDGPSTKIRSIYNEFYNSLDDEKRGILDSMTKFTYNAVYKCLGMRATDNCTTLIRQDIKDLLYELYAY